MPSTRSQGQAQPTLAFPRRRSCRVSSRSKTAPVTQPDPQFSTQSLTQTGPGSPRRPTPLSPRRPAAPAPPPSPRLLGRLPLSPSKRAGDDNGCNLGPGLLGSPPKQSKPSLASPRRLCVDENSPVPPSPRRKETPCKSPAAQNPDRPPPVLRLFDKESKFQSVKQALHTAIPDKLQAREAEREAIRSFLEEKVLRRRPGSLYISGAPGTGKTACFNCVLQDMKPRLAAVRCLLVNCMALRSSRAIFPLLAEQLKAGGGQSGLQRFLSGPRPAVLLVLDEMDQLDSKAQDVLYTLFEWPYLPDSRLCLVGIANALDLTDRILPRLQARPHCRPRLLHFPPYSREELAAIVQDRLAQASAGGVVEASAVQFCARKVSAVSGDARKALDVCRRAFEVLESDQRKEEARQSGAAGASKVGLPQVARVLSEVYGDRMASDDADAQSFPLQQKLLVCCLLLLVRDGRSKEVVLGKLHEAYSRLCAGRQVSAVGQGECLSLCGLLESRGVFALKKAKEARLTKVFLKIEEKDVENALRDRTLMGSILAAGLPS